VFFTGGLNFSRTHNAFNIMGPNDPKVAKVLAPSDKADIDQALSELKQVKTNGPTINVGSDQANAFFTGQAKRAISNPQAFMAATAEWGNRVAVLMLPIAALMLSVLFLFKKNVYVFDHLIFTMHSLSFQGLLISAMFVAGIWVDQAWWGLWLSPVHLFFHMRGAYRSRTITTLIRMFLLFIGSSVAFGLLMAGLLLIGLATVK
jgi:hypothetical protein